MEQQLNAKNLPNNWAICELDDVILRISNGANVTQHEENVGYPISRIETIWNEGIDLGRVKYIRENDRDFVEKYALQYGDILLSHINSDAHLGKTGLFKNQVETLIHGINILLIRSVASISSEFLNYQLKHLRAKGVFIDAAQRAVNQSSINQKKLKSFQIVVAPLPEQHRIVAKIEELFSELDKGIENLKTARAQLKVYRQALLKHAFEGKLTAQWRKENQGKLETADALLKRIQQERAERYQQQLADWEAAGKQGSKPKAPKPLPPLTAEELAELPELPEGWGWMKYGDLCSIVRNGISAKPEGDSGTPIFRISAVRPLFFDMADIRFIDNATGKFDAYSLERGDLVFTRYNGSRHYVGVCAEYRSDEKRLFPDKLVQTRLFSKELLSSYFEKTLNSGASRHFLESKIRTTAGQSGVSGDDIKNVPVPICPINEQIEIVALLESKLSAVDQLELTIAASLQQAEALRQSILKKAFSGQLVPQDPHDEPASVLLECIQAEKAALVTPIKKGKKYA